MVATVEDFVQWTKGLQGRSLLYRGLANVNWRVESAAYRRIEASEGAPENHRVFKNYTLQLLEKASNRGLRLHEGRMLSHLELLAQLQHFGAATCLIDFTYNPLAALWFACREQSKKDGSKKDGKVVAMDSTRTGAAAPNMAESDKLQNEFQIVDYEKSKENIENFLDNKTLWQWEPLPRENRVIAQYSIFVFGKERIEDRFEAVCIPASKKSNICAELHEKFGVTEENLFGDLAGFALANAHDKPYQEYSADDYYESAYRFFQKNQMEKAIRHCAKSIEADSQHVESHHLRGICNLRKKPINWKQAAKDFSRAIELDHTHAESFLWRALVHRFYAEEPQKASADYAKTIELASSSEVKSEPWVLVSAYDSRGDLKAEQGEHHSAVEDFNAAIAHDANKASTYFNRSKSHRALGNHQEAQKDYKKAVELDPNLRDDSLDKQP